MPELKRSFTGGRMEKDLDARIVGQGTYREALNIEIATSEGSDVGAVQNIFSNTKVTEALRGPGDKYINANKHIAHIVDKENDKLYRFVSTESASALPHTVQGGTLSVAWELEPPPSPTGTGVISLNVSGAGGHTVKIW